MEFFAHYHEEYLKKYIELKNGIPSHDTLCRVFGMLSPEVLQQLYQKWQELLNRDEGKALRKSLDKTVIHLDSSITENCRLHYFPMLYNNNGSMAVSYTHLDVYKRQVYI